VELVFRLCKGTQTHLIKEELLHVQMQLNAFFLDDILMKMLFRV